MSSPVREALGPEEVRRCRNEGRAMTEHEAPAEAHKLAEELRERVPDGPAET